MKKLLTSILLTLILALAVLPALADTADGPTDFFSWASLGTFAGAVAATVFIVQACKLPADKVFGHVPTRLIVYIIALALLLMSQGFLNGGLTFETVCLAVVNAFLVSLAAMSTYSIFIEQTEIRKMMKTIANEKTEDQETDPPSGAADAAE